MDIYYVEVYDEVTRLYEPIMGFDVNHPDQVVWQASEELTEDQAHDRYEELSKARAKV